MKQFFGRTTWIALGTTFLLYVLALAGYLTEVSPYLLTGLGVTTFIATLKRPEWGIYIAFLELFSNPHGIILSTNMSGFSVSLRMTVFVAVMVAWAWRWVTRKTPTLDKHLLHTLSVLGLGVAVGVTMGLLSRGPGAVFADMNAYLYLLYTLPILSIRWDLSKKRELLQVLTGAVIWTASMTLGLVYVFTHADEAIRAAVYSFFRDLRIAEITQLNGDVYRIFSQSQIFTFVLGFMLLIAPVEKGGWGKRLFMGALIYATIVLGLSRSFWVGIVPALAVLGVLWWRTESLSRAGIKRIFMGNTLAALGAVVLIITAMWIPIPANDLTSGQLLDSLKDRTTETNDAAISSRWQLLGPMVQNIQASPLVGQGFGATVTYITNDPRAREINPDGIWTVVAMEWGWLELWLKMGALGVLGFLYLGYELIARLKPHFNTPHAWLGISLISTLVFLFSTHIFSPYLNHPIGLGIILFMVPFLHKQKNETLLSTSAKRLVEPLYMGIQTNPQPTHQNVHSSDQDTPSISPQNS